MTGMYFTSDIHNSIVPGTEFRLGNYTTGVLSIMVYSTSGKKPTVKTTTISSDLSVSQEEEPSLKGSGTVEMKVPMKERRTEEGGDFSTNCCSSVQPLSHRIVTSC